MFDKIFKEFATALMGACATIITAIKTIALGGTAYIVAGYILIAIAVIVTIAATVYFIMELYRAHKAKQLAIAEAEAKAKAEARAKARARAKANCKKKKKRKKKR